MSDHKKHHKPPLLAQWLLNHILPDDNWQTPLGDFEEYYNIIASENSIFRAQVWYWCQILNLIPRKIYNTFYGI